MQFLKVEKLSALLRKLRLSIDNKIYFFFNRNSLVIKAGLIFKLFISKVSWLTLIAACYFGYKNFSVGSTVIGIVSGVLLVHIGFYFLRKFLISKFSEKNLLLFKTFLEYSLIAWVIYYIFF